MTVAADPFLALNDRREKGEQGKQNNWVVGGLWSGWAGCKGDGGGKAS
jgi:hypothetical protein